MNCLAFVVAAFLIDKNQAIKHERLAKTQSRCELDFQLWFSLYAFLVLVDKFWLTSSGFPLLVVHAWQCTFGFQVLVVLLKVAPNKPQPEITDLVHALWCFMFRGVHALDVHKTH